MHSKIGGGNLIVYSVNKLFEINVQKLTSWDINPIKYLVELSNNTHNNADPVAYKLIELNIRALVFA